MVKFGRYAYLVLAGLFTVGVLVQVFLAGMVVVAQQMGWGGHVSLGHMLAGPLIFMLITMYFGKLPRSLKWLTWGLFVVYALQADVLIFLRASVPVLSALHPVLALLDFAMGYALFRAVLKLVKSAESPAAMPVGAARSGPTTGYD